jgi:Domain of unknown function (DUF4253)
VDTYLTEFNFNNLTEQEITFFKDANLEIEDGLFLKEQTKRPVEPLIFPTEYPEIHKPNGICSLTSEENARRIVTENYDKFISKGKFIFINQMHTHGFNIGIVGMTSDAYEVMKYVEMSGPIDGQQTEDIITKIKKWESEFGIKPIGIGCDFCECEIRNRDIDFKKLANEFYEFRITVTNPGSVEFLAEEMEKTSKVFLWWDYHALSYSPTIRLKISKNNNL